MQVTERQKKTPDGWTLNALDMQPDQPPHALVVAGHAMMVDRRTLYREGRPSLAKTLVDAGFRVLLADLRGHGQSGPRAEQGGQWTYDDLVADTQTWREWADELRGDLPVIWLSHSLFGHVSLAWFGQHPQRQPDAFVAFAVNAWNHRFEPNPALWQVKSLMMKTTRLLAKRKGRMPAKLLRMGNHDEALPYWLDLTRMAHTRWESRQGVNYHEGLANVTCPILCVWSEGDKLFTRPVDGLGFTQPLPNREVLILGKDCQVPELRGLAPGHMEMATDPRAQPVWQHVARWMLLHAQMHP